MLSSGDVIWEHDNSSNRDLSKDRNLPPPIKSSHKKKKNAVQKSAENFSRVEVGDLENTMKEKTVNNGCVTLKDLSQKDKQKIAQLIKELAKVGEEKENIVHVLNNERQKFFSQVLQLEEEKKVLANKQQFLTEEVKQCQTLLQYYQNLITMQQSSLVALEESRKQMHLAASAENPKSSDDERFQDDAIKVNELKTCESSASDSTFTEDDVLRMSDRQYKSYLRRKKEKLSKEQESLRKLLTMKDDSELELGKEISPNNDRTRLSDSRRQNISKRSVPVQTLSPIPVRESESYASPSRSNTNKTSITLAGPRQGILNKSIPVQTLSPITVGENESYTSLSRNASEKIRSSGWRQDISNKSTPAHKFSPKPVKETTSYLSPYRSTSDKSPNTTLQRSTSPEKILHLLSQDIDPLQENLSHSVSKPMISGASSCSISYSESTSLGTTNCDDSQLLQEIFFV